MSLFSRIFIVLTCLALITGAVAIAVLAWTIPADSIDWLRNATGWMAEHNANPEKTILAVACGGVGFLALVMMILALLPKSSSDVKVKDLKIGDAVLSTAAIGQRVDEAVQRVPHVASVKSTIRAKRKGVLVSLDLFVDPDANLATVTDESCEAATNLLNNRLHVALQQPPHCVLHYRELRLRGRQPVRPAGVQEVPAVPQTPRTPQPPIPPTPQAAPTHIMARQAPSSDTTTVPARPARESGVAVAEPEVIAPDQQVKELPAE